MPTEQQIAANKVNAQKSTGPKTTSGKEASAGNALKHGLSAKKYLTPTETYESFEALYLARRRLYPPDDPIIDRLVEKITLAHFRIDRGFEAEAQTLQQGSLAEMLIAYDKPIKNLGSYEASNRKTLKLLEEELARYVCMLREAVVSEPLTAPSTQPGKRAAFANATIALETRRLARSSSGGRMIDTLGLGRNDRSRFRCATTVVIAALPAHAAQCKEYVDNVCWEE
jgi:hypothetical protein